MNKFFNELKEEMNVAYTENGAKGYKTTNSSIADYTFHLPAMRNIEDADPLGQAFLDVLKEEGLETAFRWAFWVRDARGGAGERRTFRAFMRCAAEEVPGALVKVLPLIPEYGRWDDLVDLLSNEEVRPFVVEILSQQLLLDIANADQGKPISLLAKWMPSENTSSPKTRELARLFIKTLGLQLKGYRQLLSKLRKHLQVVERKMSQGEWSEIDYEAVPSLAMLRYRNAFSAHDGKRYSMYKLALSEGAAKINAAVAAPHDIVARYGNFRVPCKDDPILEAAWKALPNYGGEGLGKTLVVADGSGSMNSPLARGVTALQVANALAIYFAERAQGPFKNHYITFSNKPCLVHLKGRSLRENLAIASKHDEVANTNIERTFQLILDTAVKSGCTQEELPETILVISDMEFDECASADKRLFEEIAAKFAEHGYKLPQLVFWNLNSQASAIPVKENEKGVILLSGFSPASLDIAYTGEHDPRKAIIKGLMRERYDAVGEALASH